MPVLSWGHSAYWAGAAGTPSQEVGASANGGYILWQEVPINITVITSLLLSVRILNAFVL